MAHHREMGSATKMVGSVHAGQCPAPLNAPSAPLDFAGRWVGPNGPYFGMRLQLRKLPALAVVATIALAGCESTNTLDPSQITVVSLSDDFSFSATALDNVSDGERYFLSMTATQAVVDVTQAISSGTPSFRSGTAAAPSSTRRTSATRSTIPSPWLPQACGRSTLC